MAALRRLPGPGDPISTDRVLDDDGDEAATGDIGAIVVKLPLPPGCLPTLWNDDDGFRDSYLSTYRGYYNTADGGYIDENGYVFVMARTDDVINVAGHRLSTGAMEEVLADHADVAECAVVKCGPEGAWIARRGEASLHVPAAPVDLVSTLGAGDAFAGGYLAGTVMGLDAQATARLAVETAARAVAQSPAR